MTEPQQLSRDSQPLASPRHPRLYRPTPSSSSFPDSLLLMAFNEQPHHLESNQDLGALLLEANPYLGPRFGVLHGISKDMR